MSDYPSGATSDFTEVRYQIDGDDALVHFNHRWDDFAAENDSPSLQAQHIAGRSLWDFISSPEVKHLHQKLLTKVRSGGKPVTLPFRCDAPALRRFMEMDIVRLPDGNVEYRCRVLRTEARRPVLLPRGAGRDNGALIRMCSWCNKVEADAGLWLEIEDAVTRLDLFGREEVGHISHTMCQACMALLEGADK